MLVHIILDEEKLRQVVDGIDLPSSFHSSFRDTNGFDV
jgi:hypothetical protein